jgi:hypothetical protein
VIVALFLPCIPLSASVRLILQSLTIIAAGRSRTLAAAPHELLRSHIEEWSKKLQSLEAAGGSPKEKDKEEAMVEVARAMEKLMQIYGQKA